MQIWALAVTFETTSDDKDRGDVVTIAASAAAATIATQALGDGQTVWNDPSVLGPFGLWFNQSYESSTIRFSVSKTGTDGWNFNVVVVGIDQAGNRKQLLRADGLHFQHGLENASWVLAS